MTRTTPRIVLDLCGGTGAWSRPWATMGYTTVVVDPAALLGRGNFCVDVEGFAASYKHAPSHFGNVIGVLAAPPCTEFASSGARWWAGKNPSLLRSAVKTVEACLDVVSIAREAGSLEWWCMENPVGRMRSALATHGERRIIGHPTMTFDPYEYAGWAQDPDTDRYTKRTCLWGDFTPPVKRSRYVLHPKGKSPIHQKGEGKGRMAFRSITPEGFARAFFWANGGQGS